VKPSSRHKHRREVVRGWYDRLLAAAGPRGWWPGDGRDEIIIGAVLAQNTAWKNVEQALDNLRGAGMLRLRHLVGMDPKDIAPLIRPSGYFNLKARRLHSVATFFAPGGNERFDELEGLETDELRRQLLGVWGIGPETVDCILLYALGRLSFVVDAYTLRVVERHGLAPPGTTYETARRLFTELVDPDPALYNEFHALLVWVGHHYCKPNPRCADCPLSSRECFPTGRAWNALAKARSAGAGARGPGRAAV
jgi:endonuclease III related protein